jgi:hypothetical protein
VRFFSVVLVSALALPGAAWAQFIADVKVEPAQLKVGETATITVGLDLGNQKLPNCGLRLHYGDGTTQDFKLNQAKDSPLVTTRAWNKAGEFRVMAEGKSQGPLLAGCGGKNQEAFVKVQAPAPAAAPAKPAAAPKPAAASAPMPACPEGWRLDAKSVNRKTGAYTCTAKAGTKPPAAKLECPGDTGYFENQKRGQLGCRL